MWMYNVRLSVEDEDHCPLCEEPLGTQGCMEISIDGIPLCYMHPHCATLFKDISERIMGVDEDE